MTIMSWVAGSTSQLAQLILPAKSNIIVCELMATFKSVQLASSANLFLNSRCIKTNGSPTTIASYPPL
jgi:hypothetical protein